MTKTGKFSGPRAVNKSADRRGRSTDARKPEGPPDMEKVEFREGQSVELLIGSMTEIGYTAVINGSREGLLYKNEVFRKLRKGQRIAGFIKKVREDGKIDLCLQRPGHEKVDDVSGTILDALKAHDGFIPVTDRSEPETIYRVFGASKKTFKKAIGALYKKRIIQIGNNGIRLLKP